MLYDTSRFSVEICNFTSIRAKIFLRHSSQLSVLSYFMVIEKFTLLNCILFNLWLFSVRWCMMATIQSMGILFWLQPWCCAIDMAAFDGHMWHSFSILSNLVYRMVYLLAPVLTLVLNWIFAPETRWWDSIDKFRWWQIKWDKIMHNANSSSREHTLIFREWFIKFVSTR